MLRRKKKLLRIKLVPQWCNPMQIPSHKLWESPVERPVLLRITNLALLAHPTTKSSDASLKSHVAVTPWSLQCQCPSPIAYTGLATATTLKEVTLSPCSLEGKGRNPIVCPHVQIALKS